MYLVCGKVLLYYYFYSFVIHVYISVSRFSYYLIHSRTQTQSEAKQNGHEKAEKSINSLYLFSHYQK